LNPLGQDGLTAVTFLVVLPFTQVMVVFFTVVGLALGVGVGLVSLTYVSFNLIVG
jgi:hypothetical protein